MIIFLKKQWFLLGLIFIFIFVLLEPTGILVKTGIALKNHNGPDILIFLIFLMSGLIIETEQIKSGIKDVKSTLTALLLIIIVSPVVAIMLSLVVPLDPGVMIGLFIVSVMPTTLSSGVVMTDKSGGNMAHALFITILSNIIAIISIPLIISFLLNFFLHGKNLSIDQQAIIIKLIFLVLLPLLSGMVLKQFFLSITPTQKQSLQVINQFLIIGIVFMSLSGTKEILLANASITVVIVPLMAGFHLILLLFAFMMIYFFNIDKGRRESVIFMGSQKTLPLSVMLQMVYFPEFGTALLVCVLHHIIHLMIDGYLCVKLK